MQRSPILTRSRSRRAVTATSTSAAPTTSLVSLIKQEIILNTISSFLRIKDILILNRLNHAVNRQVNKSLYNLLWQEKCFQHFPNEAKKISKTQTQVDWYQFYQHLYIKCYDGTSATTKSVMTFVREGDIALLDKLAESSLKELLDRYLIYIEDQLQYKIFDFPRYLGFFYQTYCLPFFRDENGEIDLLKRDISCNLTAIHWAVMCHQPIEEIAALLSDYDSSNNNNKDLISYLSQILILHVAATAGNVEALKYFINKGVSVNLLDNMSRTALHLAARQSNDKVVAELIKANNSLVHKCDEDNAPAIYYAVERNKLKNASLLIEVNSPVEFYHADGRVRPLCLAIVNEYSDMAQLLIRSGANVNSHNGCHAKTPLHIAAEYGDVNLVDLLLESGAEITAKETEHNDTPLHIAAKNGKIEIVYALLRAGAYVNSENRFEETALHQSVGFSEDIFKMAQNVDTLITSKQYQKWREIDSERCAMINLLIAANANVNACNSKGDTPLHNAAKNFHIDAMYLLINAGADLTKLNRQNLSPLPIENYYPYWVSSWHYQISYYFGMVMARNQYVRSKRYDKLVSHVLAPDKRQNTIDNDFFDAIKSGDITSFDECVANGETINQTNSEGDSPLSVAIDSCQVIIAIKLIARGAKVDEINSRGWAPLHQAAFYDDVTLLEQLMLAGASLLQVTINEEMTAFDVANERQNTEARKYLHSLMAYQHQPMNYRPTLFGAVSQPPKQQPIHLALHGVTAQKVRPSCFKKSSIASRVLCGEVIQEFTSHTQ